MYDPTTVLLLDEWLAYRQLSQPSAHTLSAYRRDVIDFLEFCQQRNIGLAQLERADIQDYLVIKIEQEHLKSKSLQRKLSAIRQFMQWLNLHYPDILPHNPSKDVQVKNKQRHLPGLMDEQLIAQLLDQDDPQLEHEQPLWIRDRAILELFYSSGLRLSELQALCFQDFDFRQKFVQVLGKGNKQRRVPIGSKAIERLVEWFAIYKQWKPDIQLSDPVFISQQGTMLSARQIQNRVKYHAIRAGIPINLHPHLLRHSFASHVLTHSGDLRAVQEMLGHEHLSTTQIYTHLNFQELQKEYYKRHPRAKGQ